MKLHHYALSIFFFGGVGALAALTIASPKDQPPLDREPPLELTLHIDDRAVRVVEAESFNIKVGAKTVEMKVETEPNRTFRTESFDFRYPRQFLFEFDGSDPSVPVWSFDGARTGISLLRVGGILDEAEIVRNALQGMTSKLKDAKDIRIEDSSIKLGGKSLNAKRLQYTMIGRTQQHEFVGFKSAKHTYVLFLRTDLDDTKTLPEEAKLVRKLLEDSFRFGPRTAEK